MDWHKVTHVFILLFAFAFARTCVFIQLICTPLAGKQLTNSNVLATFPLAFFFFGGTFAAPPASWMMAKIGRKLGFIFGSIVGILGGLVFFSGLMLEDKVGVVGTFLASCLGSCLLGAANGFTNLYRFAAADIAPERRALAISFVLGGGDASALIGPSLSEWTKGLFHQEFAATYLSICGLFLCCIFCLLFVDIPPMQSSTKEEDEELPPRSVTQVLSNPRCGLALANATIGYSMMVLLMVLVPIVMLDDGFSFGKKALVMQLHTIGMFVPSFFIGFFIERVGCVTVSTVGIVVLEIACGVLAIGSELWNFLVGMLLVGVGWNFVFVSSTTLLTQSYRPSEKAKCQAVNDFILFMFVSTFSLFSGLILNILGSWKRVTFIPMVLCAIAFACTIGIMVNEKVTAEPKETELSESNIGLLDGDDAEEEEEGGKM